MWQRIGSIATKHPFAFGVTISTVKTSFSDLLVQKVVEKRDEIDWRRNLVFASFGCMYLGGVQYVIYVPLFSKMFPNAARFAAMPLKEKLKDTRGMLNVVAQVFIDQCIHHPLLYFPVFYTTKDLVMAEEFSVMESLNEYKRNMKDDLIALWKIWVPSTMINFAFMPMWGRIPWVAGTSLLWTCILSAMRGGSVSDAEDIVGGAVTGASLHVLENSITDFYASPVELDLNRSHVCVSAHGPDKIGWIAKMAREIADNKGSITHSNMVRLGSEFIVTMHVAVRPEIKRQLVSSLLSNEELEPLNIRVSSLSRRQTGEYVKAVMGLRIHCVGEDKPGMLASIAEKIASEGLSTDNITTKIQAGTYYVSHVTNQLTNLFLLH